MSFVEQHPEVTFIMSAKPSSRYHVIFMVSCIDFSSFPPVLQVLLFLPQAAALISRGFLVSESTPRESLVILLGNGAEPISFVIGKLFEDQTDYVLAGFWPLDLYRYSSSRAVRIRSSTTPREGLLLKENGNGQSSGGMSGRARELASV